jgi:hypothetical protein
VYLEKTTVIPLVRNNILDVTKFPFDIQTCTLQFGSWIYNGFQVDINIKNDHADLTSLMSNVEWVVDRNCKTVSDSTTVTPKATFSPESTGSIYDNVANSVITMDGKSISV